MKLAQSEIRKNVMQFIERLRIIMIRDSVRKKTWKETWETIQSKTIDFYEKKLPLIARNMVGNAFSFMQKNMMSVLGINFYRWKTAGDEAVRKTHRPLEGKICRWDDASLYSTDGITWQEKTNDMVKKHPSEDYNCRCTAQVFIRNEIKEIDKTIKGL
jgi:SPP1 gp7 family putative phage head morphogenesis protein